ncbi:Oidioi.mRNA.OKI2018_I69.chr1.g3501.t1.cds [Oikopleura dioica]|uniref:receptor protein serine/threonine kinase n=1 Tax=Oikopleura dioica TaxID=34765 RepID=A0ABN7T3G9_OIKDI|nr:Oidioi.mRNA.OKI2018_I69.chr1.g3501.t1.cds [Oikopleura dioica]
MGLVFKLLLPGSLALQCFYDQRVSPFPLPKNESTGQFLLGTAETLVDLDEPSNKHLSGIIFKDLVNLIDNYYYYYGNGSSPVDKQDLLENGIDFNDPKIQQILDISSGSIYKATYANHAGNNGDQLYFSPCSFKSNRKISPQVVQKTTPFGEDQLWCAVSHYPCGMDSKIKDDNPLAYRCHTRAECKGPNHETKSCDNSENYYISYAICFHAPHSTMEIINETCDVESEVPKEENETIYIGCRCRSDNCNHHMNINHSWKEFEPEEPEAATFNLYKLISITVPILCGVVVVFAFVYKFYVRRKTPSNNGMNGTHNEQIPILPTQNGNDSRVDLHQDYTIDVDHQDAWVSDIQLHEKFAEGKYGTVWTGLSSDNRKYAVKCLQDKNSYDNERSIYMMLKPLMDIHKPNILTFLGAQERYDVQKEYWIVTEYHEVGSLSDFLHKHTLTFSQLLNVIATMADGLRFLHEDMTPTFTQLSEGKPSVAHRDLKSKNVLLKNDLTAVLSDFGLAIQFKLGENLGDAHPSVGTRRYMAPEILERAISFHRDAFLRIDMYAFALVMWECLSRCKDLPRGPAHYSLPYENELGTQPTLEDLQNNIVDNNLRPKFKKKDDAYDDPPWSEDDKFKNLCETIRDCWDCDAEARLTAGCVLKRVQEIQAQFGCNADGQAPMYSLSRQSSSGGSSGGLPMPEHSIVGSNTPNGLTAQGSHSMLSHSNGPSTSTPHPDPLMIQQRQQPRLQPNEPIFNYLNNQPLNPPRSNPCDPNMTIPENVTMHNDGTFERSQPLFRH